MKRIDQFPVSKTDQISQFGDPLIRPVQKGALRLGCGLDSQVLSLKCYTNVVTVVANKI